MTKKLNSLESIDWIKETPSNSENIFRFSFLGYWVFLIVIIASVVLLITAIQKTNKIPKNQKLMCSVAIISIGSILIFVLSIAKLLLGGN